MAVKKLIDGNDPLLKREVQDVTKFDANLSKLILELEDALYHYNGVGIAAPQIGVDLKVALIDMEEDGILQLINPKIIDYSKETDIEVEGCLSFPDIFGTVERSTTIVLTGQDVNGRPVEMTAHDDIARIIQHEVDHLYGKLFTEKIIKPVSVEELEEMYHD